MLFGKVKDNQKLSLIVISAMILVISSCAKQEIKPQKELKEIVIADINSTNVSNKEYVQHYQAGVQLALKEINSKGGINGIKLKIEYYDDYANYMEAYRAASLAMKNPNVVALMGTFLSQPAKALGRFAKEKKIVFLANGTPNEDIIKGDSASEWTFRLKSGADLNIEALADKIAQDKNVKTFSILSYSSVEGDYITDKIKEKIKEKRSDVKFIGDVKASQFNTYGSKLADDVYNTYSQGLVIAVDGVDIQRLVLLLEQNKATINKKVYILYAGEYEWLDSLGRYTPSSWIATGLPWYSINTEANINFYKKYEKIYKSKPRYASYLGYISVYMLAEAIKEANIHSNNIESREKIVQALSRITIRSPLGVVKFLKDNESNLGVYVGTLKPYDKVKQEGGNKLKILDVRMFDSKYVTIDEANIDFTNDIIENMQIRKDQLKIGS